MKRSLILLAAGRVLMPLLLLYAAFLFWRGHNAPGGGFVGGLVAACAFVMYTLMAGLDASRRALHIEPSRLLSLGLAIALVSGIPGLLAGGAFMTAIWGSVGIGDVRLPLGTPLLFDLGVFLAVMGVVLTIVFALGEATLTEE